MPGPTSRRFRRGRAQLERWPLWVLIVTVVLVACASNEQGVSPFPVPQAPDTTGPGRIASEPGLGNGRAPGEPSADAPPAVLHVIGRLDVLPADTTAWPIASGVIPASLATITSLGCVVGDDDCPAERLGLLADGGVDVVNMATTTVGSTDSAIVADVVVALGESGVAVAGFGANLTEAVAPVIVQSGDFSVAIHAISLVDDATEQSALATAESAGVAGVDAFTELLLAMQTSVSEGHQVVVLVDWGDPERRSPDPGMIAMAESLVRGGADAIIGGGSDFLNRLEVIEGSPVAFDLGQAATTTDDALRRDTAILRLMFGSDTEAPCLLPATADSNGPTVDNTTEVRCTTG